MDSSRMHGDRRTGDEWNQHGSLAARSSIGRHRDHRTGEEWNPLDEHGLHQLGIAVSLARVFTDGRLLSREEYELLSASPGSTFAYTYVPPYHEYLRLYDR